MGGSTTRMSLDEPSRKLLDLATEIGFGRIEALWIHDGAPVLGSDARIVRTTKFGADGARAQALPTAQDFELSRHWTQFFEELKRIGNGRIDRLEIRHGQPIVLEIQADPTGTGDEAERR